MADVILDSDTRAPSPSWAKVLRIVAAAATAKLALWLSGWGVALDAGDQVAIVTLFVALVGAIGTEARDRGWPVLRLLAVPLALLALSGPVACASVSSVRPPPEAYAATLGTYRALAAGMAAYCASPEAKPDPCVRAARATLTADRVIGGLEALIRSGAATDASYAAAEISLRDAMPALSEVQP